METSIFLAKLWGWYFILFFFMLSFQPSKVKELLKNLRNEHFITFSSFLAIFIGLLNILFHNIWELNWRLIITLIGWISLSKGVFMFVLPLKTVHYLELINLKLVQVLYILLFMVGAYLLNVVYTIIPY